MESGVADAHPIVRYRNRAITKSDLEFLRSLLSRGWERRTDLAHAVCDAWSWKQANGAPSVQGCLDLLRRLEEWGHIQLPPPHPLRRSRNIVRREHPLLPADLIALMGLDIRDPANLGLLIVRPITTVERDGWRLYMGRYHYLGDRRIVGEHLLYAAFLDDELVALLGWAGAALRAPLRDQYVGWDEPTMRGRLHLVVNNVRFLILPWVRVRHLASKVLALNLRRLSSDWLQAWKHPIHLAETFVDTTRYRGTCYRASNWIYLGDTAGRSKRGNTYLRGSSRKALFVYPLGRRSLRCLRGEKP